MSYGEIYWSNQMLYQMNQVLYVDGIRLWEGHGGMALERMWKVLVCPESLECTGSEQMEKESQEGSWLNQVYFGKWW